jgi:hypothetical protein
MEQENSCLWSRTEMCSLADLASGFVLSLCMRVGRDLGNEYNKQHREAESQQSSQGSSRFYRINHLDFQGTLSLALTPRPFRSEQHALPSELARAPLITVPLDSIIKLPGERRGWHTPLETETSS